MWQATSKATAQIPICVTRGYPSWGDFHTKILKGYKRIYPPTVYNWKVFFLYDYDQDGGDAENIVREQFQYFFTSEELEKIAFARIAITPNQAKSLPRVNVRLVTKMQKAKFKRWIQEHGAEQQSDGSLRIHYWELESMRPKQLVDIIAKMLTDSIDMNHVHLEQVKEEKEKDRVEIESDIDYDGFERVENEDELDDY